MKKKNVILTVAIAFVLGWVCNCTFNAQKPVRDDFLEKLVIDTVYVDTTDTTPRIENEIVTKYIKIPVPVPVLVDSGKIDTCLADSVELPVVQRTYTDDSTYTAYVSGVEVDSFPRLDSICVRMRTIIKEHEVERTITKKQPITWGLQFGSGYGIITKQPDIYIGLGIQWNF